MIILYNNNIQTPFISPILPIPFPCDTTLLLQQMKRSLWRATYPLMGVATVLSFICHRTSARPLVRTKASQLSTRSLFVFFFSFSFWRSISKVRPLGVRRASARIEYYGELYSAQSGACFNTIWQWQVVGCFWSHRSQAISPFVHSHLWPCHDPNPPILFWAFVLSPCQVCLYYWELPHRVLF